MMERKKTLNVFKDAQHAWGSYDDFPVGQPGTDPMPHLSRNRCAQPFFLIHEADQVLVHMAGRAELQLHGKPAIILEPGDTVYIPARIPSRLVAITENVQLRLKVELGAREAVAWFCPACDARVHVVEIEPGIVQAAYLAAVEAWNADAALRTCACGAIHPPADLGDIAWAQTAAALAAV